MDRPAHGPPRPRRRPRIPSWIFTAAPLTRCPRRDTSRCTWALIESRPRGLPLRCHQPNPTPEAVKATTATRPTNLRGVPTVLGITVPFATSAVFSSSISDESNPGESVKWASSRATIANGEKPLVTASKRWTPPPSPRCVVGKSRHAVVGPASHSWFTAGAVEISMRCSNSSTSNSPRKKAWVSAKATFQTVRSSVPLCWSITIHSVTGRSD